MRCKPLNSCFRPNRSMDQPWVYKTLQITVLQERVFCLTGPAGWSRQVRTTVHSRTDLFPFPNSSRSRPGRVSMSHKHLLIPELGLSSELASRRHIETYQRISRKFYLMAVETRSESLQTKRHCAGSGARRLRSSVPTVRISDSIAICCSG